MIQVPGRRASTGKMPLVPCHRWEAEGGPARLCIHLKDEANACGDGALVCPVAALYETLFLFRL